MKTYRRIASLEKGIYIFKAISRGQKSIKTLSETLNISRGTLRCYLATLEYLELIKIRGDQIEFGGLIALLKERRCEELHKINTAVISELDELRKI